MANDLISRKALITDLRTAKGLGKIIAETIVRFLKKQPTVDAVEVVRIKEVKQNILQQMDMFIAEYDRIGFYGKSDAMEIARRLVNAALTDLAKMDGERKDNG